MISARIVPVCLVCLLAVPRTGAAATAAVETIVLVRHGEKPAAGLGQLDCQGLNRALALGGVLERQFGRPDAMFASNPAVPKQDRGITYDYIRPLATIEPAAIAFGLPVDASIGYADLPALLHALDDPKLGRALVVVAWEHTEIVKLARQLLSGHDGQPAQVPAWDKADFDSMYVVRIARDGARSQAGFERRREGLDGQPASCPTGKAG